MYVEFREVLLVFHIFLGITWVGGVLFIGWGVLPVIKTITLKDQQTFLITLMRRTHVLLSLAGVGVILTGILLGTVFGPIKSLEHVWNTNYGTLWLDALLIAIVTLLWGMFVGYKQMMRVLTDRPLWLLAEKGARKPLDEAMMRAAAIESIEIVGFLALLVIMVQL